MTDIVILGAGGHARVLLATLSLLGLRPVGCLAKTPPDAADWPDDVPHIGDDDCLARFDPARVQLVNGRGSVGSTSDRQAVFGRGKADGFTFASVIHPMAIVDKSVRIGEGVEIMAGAVVQNGVTMDCNVLINTASVVDHDCRIGAHCHIATGARLCGAVVLAEGVHVGAGATVSQGLKAEAGAVIGAGAVVVRNVAASSTVVGNPARLLRSSKG